ncbi:alpha-hydroxy acid oxidase [Sphingomonas oryzagri]|jgi:4-hydroxymandelate oxidase|uniref:Alpha-hydroxy acid oxidase n=1 Tax=Sphingomonas oryzagri TaxID=3042314 RepID=A0ABT6MZ85_9SPHN|nr:alpha-hydroxy acid oxidase [Sphingomonas oryzagri]MDH7638330.1 alpha-hydroxy acid oxidase [Sphingomonas oryzagri]
MVDDLSAIPPEIRTLADYEKHAEACLPAASWDHIQSGSGSDSALRDNRAAFDRWRLLPNVLTDLRGASTETELFGRAHVAPIMVAPLAYQCLAHPDGEMAAARAAAALETGFILSTLSSVSLEHVAQASRSAARELTKPVAPLWFQLYLQPDRADSLTLVRRAEAAGYEAIVLTIDAAIKRSEFTLPAGIEAANLQGMAKPRQHSVAGGHILFGTPLADAAPTWADVEWLRSVTDLPILLKGLVTGEAVDRAVASGVEAIVLSNHGGRVFDGFPAALDVLAHVVARAGHRLPILVDGGFRSGSDIATALALGAKVVLIGRPVFHALAVAGLSGVAHMLHILRTELELAMAQLGCPRIELLDSGRLLPHRQA